jgi:hypothetical protein
MAIRLSSHAASIILGPVLACSLSGCCHYPKAGVKQLTGMRPSGNVITLVAYGDTRTGPWGLGDNTRQAIHGKVVDDIFNNNGSIDAVIFTGDAVMSNFILWKKDYWRCFLTQSNRFRKQGIPFYPTLGNHEVLPEIVPLLKITGAKQMGFAMPQLEVQQNRQAAVARAYEAGEEPKIGPKDREFAEQAVSPIDPNTKQGRAQLKKTEKAISKGDTQAANQLGQFERQTQAAFYRQSHDARCGSDSGTFKDDYLTLAKYTYLGPLLQGRSYYSKTIAKNGLRVKLIALDTNCLDSNAQQQFFVNELKNFDGPVIVFGHHPPVDYNNPSPWPWDMVPGWDFFKPYLTNAEGKKIALWIFGHVHDYQRRDAAGHAPQAAPPVLLIAGGGGASLDSAPSSFQWQPDGWPKPFDSSAYQHVKLSVTPTSISVEVRGSPSETEPFTVIDSFSVPLK